MRKLVFAIAILAQLSVLAQTKDLDRQDKGDREAYLVQVAQKVISGISKRYYRDWTKPLISPLQSFGEREIDNREEMKKYEGRKYYAVSILYDKSKELFEMDYAARVCIWADDGTPWSIETGNGMGCEFLTIPFERYIKSKDFREIPYQQIDSDLQKYHKK